MLTVSKRWGTLYTFAADLNSILIIVDSYSALFCCTAVVQASGSLAASGLILLKVQTVNVVG